MNQISTAMRTQLQTRADQQQCSVEQLLQQWLDLDSQSASVAPVPPVSAITALPPEIKAIICEGETRFRMISDMVGGFAFVINAKPDNKLFVEWVTAPTLLKITGYSKEELDQTNWEKLPHPDDALRVQQNFSKLLATPCEIRDEYRFVSKAGETFHVSSVARSVADSTGRVIRIYAGVRDITEQKRSEAALRESEARYHAVVDVLTEGIILGAHGTVQAANASAERILGIPADQMTNSAARNPSWKAVREDGSPFPRAEHPATITLQTGKPLANVIMGIHKPSGELSWVSVNTQPLIHPGEDKPYAVVASLVDITALKNSVDVLAKSEQRYRHMFEHNSAVQLLINPDNGQIMLASPGACRFYGYSAEQLLTMNVADLNIQSPTEIHAELEQARHEKRNFFGFQHRLASGEIREVNVYSGPVEVADETYLYSIVQDVTEHKRAEQTLRESEARNRAIIDAMAEGIMLQAGDGTFIAANASAERILGLSVDQLMGRTSADPRWRAIHQDGTPFPGEDHPIVLAQQTGKAITNTIMGIHKPNGELTWVSINAEPLLNADETKPYAAVASFSDITERIQSEASIKRYIQQLEMLRKAATALTETLDLQHTLSVALASVIEASKADKGYIALLDQNMLQLTQVQGPHSWRDNLSAVDLTSGLTGRIVRTGQPEVVVQVVSDRECVPEIAVLGSQIGCPLIVQDRVIGIIVLETDRAELFTTEVFNFVQVLVSRISVAIENARLYSLSQQQLMELKALYDKVSNLEQLKSDMIRIGSHDLRNPLGLIAGFTELLKMDLWETLSVDHQHMLDQIQKATERMTNITSDILSLERIEAISSQSTGSLDLSSVVAMVFHELQTQAQAKSLDYQLLADDGSLMVTGDAAQLYEAITNLVNNAIKYTPQKGRIDLTLKAADNQAIFTVKDTGYGIPPEMQARLFQPFFRAKTEDTRDIDGTGLGLHLVKNVVERCNGKIIFQSTYGEGSVFGFQIPLVTPSG